MFKIIDMTIESMDNVKHTKNMSTCIRSAISGF